MTKERATGPVPLRRRLAASLAASIQDGRPPAGERLPGIRDMAGRLGVHRHTVAAAYRELAAAGLVVAVPGSGTFVAPPEWPLVAVERKQASEREQASAAALRAFLAREREAGRSAREVSERLERWRRQLAARRLLLVEPETGLRRLFRFELEGALAWPVQSLALRRLRRDPELALDGVLTGRPPVLGRLVDRLPAGADALPLRVTAGARELRLVRRLPAHSVVGVVTGSEAVRRRARELMATAAERGTGLLLPRPGDVRALERALRVARLIYADALCARRPPLTECGRVVELRLVPGTTLASLRTWLAGPANEFGESGSRDGGTGRTRMGRRRTPGALSGRVGGVERHPVRHGDRDAAARAPGGCRPGGKRVSGAYLVRGRERSGARG